MMNSNRMIRVCVAAALAAFAGTAFAGGLAIGTQSGSGTGNAFAGGAAAADDASVAWYNPALMTLLPDRQVAGATNSWLPESSKVGVPESAPLAATTNQSGPNTLL